MQSLRVFAAASLSMLALACSSTEFDDLRVEASSTDSAALEGKSTYAWGGMVGSILESDSKWAEPHPDVKNDIVAVTNAQLADLGMTEVTDSPALHVYYGVGVDMTRMSLPDGDLDRSSRLDAKSKAGLCIVIADAASGKRLWAGIASGDIDWDPTAEHTKERLEHGIGQMFENFPN